MQDGNTVNYEDSRLNGLTEQLHLPQVVHECKLNSLGIDVANVAKTFGNAGGTGTAQDLLISFSLVRQQDLSVKSLRKFIISKRTGAIFNPNMELLLMDQQFVHSVPI